MIAPFTNIVVESDTKRKISYTTQYEKWTLNKIEITFNETWSILFFALHLFDYGLIFYEILDL